MMPEVDSDTLLLLGLVAVVLIVFLAGRKRARAMAEVGERNTNAVEANTSALEALRQAIEKQSKR